MTTLTTRRPGNPGKDDLSLISVRRFRPDIEGLRAVAVVLVVLFHAGVPVITGGFVGVDVFFVISGYLITGHLLGEIGQHGRVRFPAFYARRARRLLPLATTVLVVTVVAYQLATSSLESSGVAVDALWTALFAVNIQLALEGVDYQANQDPSPFNHYWSLAVEEQFYLLWPLLLTVVFLLVRRLARSATARTVATAVVVAVVVAGLFAYSAVEVPAAPSESYFLLSTRAWELGVGALIAATAPWLARVSWLQNGITALLGLVAIGAAAVLYSESTLFPGTAALLPVLGSAAVIAGGLTGDHFVQRGLLGLRPVQALGRWSYGWYLWHWGPLVLCAVLLDRPLTVGEGLTLAGLTLVLAMITYTFIETPFRSGLSFTRRPRNGLLLGFACILTSVAVALSVLSSTPAVAGDPQEQAASVEIDSGSVDIAALAASGPVPGNLQPALADAAKDAPDLRAADGQSCHARIVSAELSSEGTGSCVAGGTEGGSRTVMLVGDSHAHQWLPALQAIAPANDWRLINLTKGACPLYDVQLVNNQLGRDYTECYQWRAKVWDRIATEHPAMIITSAAIFSEREGDFADRWSAGVGQTLDRLKATGAAVVTVADTPFPRKDIPKCLADHLQDAASCSFTPTSGQSDPTRRAATTAAAVQAGVGVVDPTGWFCDATQCPAVIGNALVYRDNSHISTFYSQQVAPLLQASLPAI